MSERPPPPRRGEIWDIDLGEPVGHEAGFFRPGLVVSDDEANRFGLAVVCPVTRSMRSYPTRVGVPPGPSGLAAQSFIQVESLRSISTERLARRRGAIEPATLNAVERILRLVLRL